MSEELASQPNLIQLIDGDWTRVIPYHHPKRVAKVWERRGRTVEEGELVTRRSFGVVRVQSTCLCFTVSLQRSVPSYIVKVASLFFFPSLFSVRVPTRFWGETSLEKPTASSKNTVLEEIKTLEDKHLLKIPPTPTSQNATKLLPPSSPSTHAEPLVGRPHGTAPVRADGEHVTRAIRKALSPVFFSEPKCPAQHAMVFR